ncbi:MAG: SDR family oxidoreductase [Thermodesulfobacteriota bacterium]
MKPMLTDRVALITGSGRGIGKAAALLFASEGAKVVVSDIDPTPAQGTAAEIKAAGGQAISVPGDVTDPQFASDMVQAAADAFGGIHILVNNAGFIWDGPVHKMSDEQWNKIIAVHLTAPFRLLRAASPYFREAAQEEAKRGVSIARKVVNIASTAGTRGNAGQINYSSAKSGLIGMTKTMAKEWGRFNVQVNAVAFGWVETRLTAAREEGQEISAGGQQIKVGIPVATREMLKKMIPLGRPGLPEEAAAVMLFFASPLSNYVSGQLLEMNGGN